MQFGYDAEEGVDAVDAVAEDAVWAEAEDEMPAAAAVPAAPAAKRPRRVNAILRRFMIFCPFRRMPVGIPY